MRVFIADSDPLFRTLVRLLVRKDASIVVCGADDGHSAYDKAKRFRPHLLIVADELNICSGLHLLHKLEGQMDPGTVTVLLSSTEDFSFPPDVTNHVNMILYRHDLCQRLPVLVKSIVDNLQSLS